MHSERHKIAYFRVPHLVGTAFLQPRQVLCMYNLLVHQDLVVGQHHAGWWENCPLVQDRICSGCKWVSEDMPVLSMTRNLAECMLIRLMPSQAHLTHGHPLVIAFYGNPGVKPPHPLTGWISHHQVQELVSLLRSLQSKEDATFDHWWFPDAYTAPEYRPGLNLQEFQLFDVAGFSTSLKLEQWLSFLEQAALHQEDVFVWQLDDKNTPDAPHLLDR